MQTSGTRGIGAQVARELARVPGRALVLGYRGNHERARDVVAELDCPDSPVRATPCDVSDAAQVSDLFAIADEMDNLVAVVNNTGILERQCTFDQIESDRWARILGVNVIGLACCCREAVVRMRDSQSTNVEFMRLLHYSIRDRTDTAGDAMVWTCGQAGGARWAGGGRK